MPLFRHAEFVYTTKGLRSIMLELFAITALISTLNIVSDHDGVWSYETQVDEHTATVVEIVECDIDTGCLDETITASR